MLQIFALLLAKVQVLVAYQAAFSAIGSSIIALDKGVDLPSGSGFQLIDNLLEANCTALELEDWRQRAIGDRTNFSLIARQLLVHNRKLVVLAKGNLCTCVIQEAYSWLVTAYPRQQKTKKLISEQYWWPRMAGNVNIYVSNYMLCCLS